MKAQLRERLDELLNKAQQLDPDRVLVYPMPAPGERDPYAGRLPEPGEVQTVANPERWPSGVPLPLTVGQAVAVTHELADRLIAELERDIQEAVAELVWPELQEAVLAREDIANRWPLPDGELERCPGWYAVDALMRSRGRTWSTTSPEAPPPVAYRWTKWPGEAAPFEVVAWSCAAIERLVPTLGLYNVELVERGGLPGGAGWITEDGHRVRLPPGGMALVYLAERAVDTDRRKPVAAWDAGRNHAEVVGAFAMWGGPTGQPKGAKRGIELEKVDSRVELLGTGQDVQLSLDLPGGGLNAAVVSALTAALGPYGVRHWAAFQNQLTEQGRTGRMRWTVERHLEQMGYSPASGGYTERRAEAAETANLIAGLELAVYDGPRLRHRRRLFTVLNETDELTERNSWELRALDLEINSAIYTGVRRNTGRIGGNWYPAPPALARINHRRHGPALAIGAQLPNRFRRAWREDRRGHVDLSGRNLLQMGAIPFKRNKPGRAWDRLERNLDELVCRDAEPDTLLARWEWKHHPKTLDGVVRMHAAAWLQDRTIRRVPPIERAPLPKVTTGGELRIWRKARGLTQAQLADRLGVSRVTVARAEGKPDKALTRKLKSALTELR